MGFGRQSKDTADPDVIRITSAPQSPGDELAHRQRRYVISMTVRTICFIAAVLTINIPWVSGLLLGGSLLLPYIAVVMANSASPRPADAPVPSPGTQRPELGEK